MADEIVDANGACLHTDFWVWEVKGPSDFDHIKYCKRCGAITNKSWGQSEQWHMPKLPRAVAPILPEPCKRAHLGEAHDVDLRVAPVIDARALQEQLDALHRETACIAIERYDLATLVHVLQEKIAEITRALRIDTTRLDALTKQGEDHGRMLADASALKRLDALAEQGEEHGKLLASLAEDIDFLKGGALRSAAYYGR